MKTMFEEKVFGKEIAIGVNKQALSVSILSLVAAIVLFVIAGKFSDFINIAINLLGVILAILALVKFVNCREYIYLPTHSVLVKHSLYFDTLDSSKIRANFDAGNYYVIKHNLSATNAGGVRLDVVMSKDEKYAVYRLFAYVPHTYQPITEVINVPADNVADFVQTINECVNKK